MPCALLAFRGMLTLMSSLIERHHPLHRTDLFQRAIPVGPVVRGVVTALLEQLTGALHLEHEPDVVALTLATVFRDTDELTERCAEGTAVTERFVGLVPIHVLRVVLEVLVQSTPDGRVHLLHRIPCVTHSLLSLPAMWHQHVCPLFVPFHVVYVRLHERVKVCDQELCRTSLRQVRDRLLQRHGV